MVVSPALLILALVFFSVAVVGLIVVSIQDRRRATIEARLELVMQTPVQLEDMAPAPEREGLDARVSRLLHSLPANLGGKIEAAAATTGGKVTPLKLIIVGIVAVILTFCLSSFF